MSKLVYAEQKFCIDLYHVLFYNISQSKLHLEIRLMKKIIEQITEFFDSILKLINSAKAIFLTLAPIASVLLALFNFDKFTNLLIKYHISSEDTINFISNNSNGFISILLVSLLIILVLAIRKTGKKELKTGDYTYNVIKRLHLDFAHKLRDGIYNLYLKNERVIELKQNNNTEAIKEVQGRAFDNLISDLQNFVNLIADCLSELNNDTISVCIKTINPGQANIDNLNKKAKTLVRSGNTKRGRDRPDEVVTLGRNTDFKHLCDGTNIWYHEVDLKSKFEKHEYENEADAEDWQNKYNSTIVVPIRYYNNTLNDILGFICIDSKNTKEKWSDENSFELQYLAIFADSIYTYIKLFRRLFDEA